MTKNSPRSPQNKKALLTLGLLFIATSGGIGILVLKSKGPTSLSGQSGTAAPTLAESQSLAYQRDQRLFPSEQPAGASSLGGGIAALPGHGSDGAEPSKDQNTGLALLPGAAIPGALHGNTPDSAQAKPGSELAKSEPNKEEANKKEPGCFKVTYRINPQTADGEEITLRKKSLLHLPRGTFKPASLCVRVGEDAIAFEKVKDNTQDILVGPFAESEKQITVSYCDNESHCKSTCKVANQPKKDSFLSAIGAADAGELDDDSPTSGNWAADGKAAADAKHQKLTQTLDPSLRREIARLDAPKRKKGETQFFEGWLPEKEVPACL